MSSTAEATHFFKVSCPQCSQNIEIPFQLYGHPVTCPTCEHTFKAKHAAEMQAKARKPLTKKFWMAVATAVVVLGCIIFLIWLAYKHASQIPALAGIAGNVIVFIAGAIIAVFLIIWAVLWCLFPVFVYFGMKRMEAILRQLELNTRPKK